MTDDNDQQEVARFLYMVRARLDAGRVEYGDRSFSRDPDALLKEIEEELLDVVGWASILFARLQRIRRHGVPSDV
jgi:hypothetical protein